MTDQHTGHAENLRKDPEIKKNLRRFLSTDNHTNFFFIARAYLVAIVAIGGAILFFEYQQSSGISFWWTVPVYLVALFFVGGTQHQFAGAGHEAVHHTLFKNRKLNEIASDLLCMFPIMTSTYQFRLYHLAHHQFVNDPERDPDFSLLKDSGHWMDFPVKKRHFIGMMLRQLLVADLIRYIVARIKYNTTGTHENSPYRMSEDRRRVLPSRLGVGLFLFLVVSLMVNQALGNPWLLVAVNAAVWVVVAMTLLCLPERYFDRARIKPVFHPKYLFTAQTAFYTVLLTSLGFVQMTTEFMALRYFTLLWFVPMATTFPFFMILRQVIQHGNGDRGWLTNTRVFRMSWPVRYTIFPFGMDYHLPHHMYATVPHYRLKPLHEFLMTKEAYRDKCQLVDNYIIPDSGEPRNPTVVEVLGPEYACSDDEVHIDDTVLEDWEVEEKDQILGAGRVPRADATGAKSPPRPNS